MTPSTNELIALLQVKKLLADGNPSLPAFLDWVAARLVQVHHDDENIDFVQALHRYARRLSEIEGLLR